MCLYNTKTSFLIPLFVPIEANSESVYKEFYFVKDVVVATRAFKIFRVCGEQKLLEGGHQ